ncbi:MAG: FixH family protein [Caldilinea sp.]|nr:FixH family protein [Caldilinea sp.]MDW8439343.1 FixH family protein [Caldilineaceae bacterium]
MHRLYSLVILAGLILAGCSSSPASSTTNASAPANLDFSTTRLSEAGRYRVSFTSELNPIAINRLHTWTLHVETPDGAPVENAVIQVHGDMPEHRHGMPTAPKVTQYLGDGNYRVEGMRFQMGGWWEVVFEIEANGENDRVVFNLMLR